MLLVLLLLFAMPETSFSKDKCTKGSEFVPPLCPLQLEKISRIQIKQNGARNNLVSEYTHTNCSAFKLDVKKVRKFFLRAKVADQHAAHYTLDSSLCEASGTLTFASGKRARWEIGHMMDGWLVMDGHDGLFLYCPTCKFKPFIYDLNP
jgi:hypothetical protein